MRLRRAGPVAVSGECNASAAPSGLGAVCALLMLCALIGGVVLASGDGDEDEGAGGSASSGAAVDWRPAPMEPAELETIVRGNIFAPERRREARAEPEEPADPRPEPETETPGEPEDATAEPMDPDEALVLIGVSIRDGEPCAFIENRSSGEVHRIRRPGTIGRGRIMAISLDGVAYETDGKEARIEPGWTLAGNPAGAAGMAGATGTAGDAHDSGRAASPETDSANDGDGDMSRAEILRRMRQRRASERNDEPSGRPEP